MKEFMIGSEGRWDYLLVARNGQTGLGFKLFFGPIQTPLGTRGLVLSVKYRAAVSLPHGVAFKEEKITFSSCFPSLTFNKEDETRASGMVCVYLPTQPWDVDHFKKVVEQGEIPQLICKFFNEKVNPNFIIITQEEIREYINDTIKSVIEYFGKLYLTYKIVPDPNSYNLKSFEETMEGIDLSEVNQKAQQKGLKLITNDNNS